MKKIRFFVVIHALSMSKKNNKADQYVKKNAERAYLNGADGVFIIPDYEKGLDLKAKEQDLITFYQNLEKIYKKTDFKIGLNFLLKYGDYYNLIDWIFKYKFQMIQTDWNFIATKYDKEKFPDTEFFSALAFKYSKYENLRGEALKSMCINISGLSDVPTTSGSATGLAADLEKIREIRSYLSPDSRLGIASGITTENIQSFIDAGVTDFLVATSLIERVENDFDIFDSKKIAEMARIIKINNQKNGCL